MAGITLAQAEAKLTAYLNAEEKILLGQRVSMGGKDLTQADLEVVQSGVALWDKRVKMLSRKSISVREVIPK